MCLVHIWTWMSGYARLGGEHSLEVHALTWSKAKIVVRGGNLVIYKCWVPGKQVPGKREAEAMSSDTLEVLDTNIVIILEEPLKQTVNAVSLIEEGNLATFMRKPLTVGQGLSLDQSSTLPHLPLLLYVATNVASLTIFSRKS
jgi:hypothetical protein